MIKSLSSAQMFDIPLQDFHPVEMGIVDADGGHGTACMSALETCSPPRWGFEVGSPVTCRYEVGFRKKKGPRQRRNPSILLSRL